MGRRMAPDPHQTMQAVHFTRAQLLYLRVRRVMEVILATMGLAVVALPMGLVAIGVLVTMGRPVLFVQERIAQHGNVIRLRKSHSMRTAEVIQGSRNDAERLVPFGKFIRATSLDELPSLWNILNGDMSLVGPRPLTTDLLGRYSAEQFTRHAVPAGLTGLAQINGRNATEYYERLLEGLGDDLVLGTASGDDGAALASARFLRSDRFMHYQLSGSTPAGATVRATNHLIWSAALHGREEELQKLVLGGGLHAGNGLERFKAGFGGDRLMYSMYGVIVDRDAYLDATEQRAAELGCAVDDLLAQDYFHAYRNPGAAR